MAEPQLAYIGLGSNLAQPQQQLARAKAALAAIAQSTLVGFSSLYQTKAVGPPQPDYLNAVAALRTHLAPLALLDALQSIEQAQLRERGLHWGPRTLDLDLLLYGNSVITHERLSVPHPYLEVRGFVLAPLHDLAPELVLPNGHRVASLWAACDLSDVVQWADET